MIDEMDHTLLKETYKSATLGIMEITSVLSKVESDDLNYDLNRQLCEYETIAKRCKSELERNGEPLELSYFIRADENVGAKCDAKGDNILLSVENDSVGDVDGHIARKVYENVSNSVDQVSKLIQHTKAESSYSMEIANEFLQEEKDNMHRMQSYLP